MKFFEHDQVYKAHIETTGYELYIATQNYSEFIYLSGLAVKENVMPVKIACYQAYAEFVRALYEYYVAIIKWNERTTRLPEGYDLDSKMNEAVQRLLNFYGPLRKSVDKDFPEKVPDTFGASFRQVRNRVSHADFRRMLTQDVKTQHSLASFYKEFNLHAHLLFESAQFSWGGQHYTKSYSWEVVDEFISAINNG